MLQVNEENKKEEVTVIVDGRIISLSELQMMKSNPLIRLTEISANTYKTLSRIFG